MCGKQDVFSNIADRELRIQDEFEVVESESVLDCKEGGRECKAELGSIDLNVYLGGLAGQPLGPTWSPTWPEKVGPHS